MEEPPRVHGTVHTGIGTTLQLSQPAPEQLHAAAQLLNERQRVAILAGAGRCMPATS